MATGGEEVDIAILQDETFDLLCSPCARKNRNTEAKKYCVDCKDYYCSKCVNCHEEIPALSGHKILDKGHFQPVPKQALPLVPTERCDIHNHKHVDMYCEDHDVVGCSTCIAIDHRLCKDTFFIPDYIRNNPSAYAQQDVNQELETTAKQLRECQDKFENEKERIRNNEDMTIRTIIKFKDEIIQRIRALAELTVTETNDQYRSILDKVDVELKTLHGNEMEVLSARDAIVSADNNVSQVFVSNKKGKVAAFKGNQCADECQVAIPTVDIYFDTYQIISDLLAGMNSLGKFTVEATKKAYPIVTKGVLQMNDTSDTSDREQRQPEDSPTKTKNVADDASQSARRRLKSATRLTEQTTESQKTTASQLKAPSNIMRKDHNVLLKIKEMKTFNVKIPSDQNDCYINGACVLKSGIVILVDPLNQKLKLLDGTTNTVTDYCDLPETPWQVCVINEKEVAVSCQVAGVQFVSLQTKMVLSRKIKPDHYCIGLAYVSGNLFISDQTSVFVYTLSGTKLQQFFKDPSRRGWFISSRSQLLFSCINRIAVNDDGSNIYVADSDNGLIAIDRNGAVTRKYCGPQLRTPTFVCVTDNGSILVTCSENQSIFQFGANCDFIGEVLKSETHRTFYRALAYQPLNSSLIGGSKCTDEIGIFSLV